MVNLRGARRPIGGESPNLVGAHVHHCKGPLRVVGRPRSPCHT